MLWLQMRFISAGTTAVSASVVSVSAGHVTSTCSVVVTADSAAVQTSTVQHIDEQSLRTVASDMSTVTVSTCPVSDTASLPCMSDDMQHLTEKLVDPSSENVMQYAVKHEGETFVYPSGENVTQSATKHEGETFVRQSDENVTQSAVKHEGETSPTVENVTQSTMKHEGETCLSGENVTQSTVKHEGETGVSGENVTQDSSQQVNDLNNVEQSTCTDVDHDASDNVCSSDSQQPVNQPRLSDSVVNETPPLLVVRETADETVVITKPLSDDVHCNTVTVCDTEAVSDDGRNASVVCQVAEETPLCAAAGDSKPCIIDDKELLTSTDYACLPSDTPRYDNDTSRPSESVDIGHLRTSLSPTTTSSCPALLSSCNIQPVAVQQLPSDSHISALDEDDQHKHVDFTLGESALTDSTFRRGSLDLAGRGVALSRIAEESLAGVTGDMEPYEHDVEQLVNMNGECCVNFFIIIIIIY